MVEAATGTGKTTVALAAIALLRRIHDDDLRVAIVVPTKALAAQWLKELTETLAVPSKEIGEQHSSAGAEWTKHHSVLITVINSARTRLHPVMQGWRDQGRPSLLVVDECHRAGSGYNAHIFEDTRASFALGLSATPERDDGGHEEFVYPGLGRPVFRYPLLDALDEGALASVTSILLYVDFDADERAEWDGLGRALSKAFPAVFNRHPELKDLASAKQLAAIGRLAKDDDEQDARRVVTLLSQRGDLLSSARSRESCTDSMLRWMASGDHRTLVFFERQAAAEQRRRFLQKELGMASVVYHSEIPVGLRESAFRDFSTGRVNTLLAVRALDEGIDVPDADLAIIVAGSRSKRQRIQRAGRVLRRHGDKRAMIFTILVRGTPEEAGIGLRDASLFGRQRVRHHRWPQISVDDAAICPNSTYQPVPATYSTVDRLTVERLELPTQVDQIRAGETPEEDLRLSYSINTWYPADHVRSWLGIYNSDFERIQKHIRRDFRLGLEAGRRDDLAIVHGTEIAPIERTWRKELRENQRRRKRRR